jgi:cytoskeletal protein CcmA (bactofilin family)
MTGNETAKTVLADDVEITGSVKSGSGVQVDGRLIGDLTCGGNAWVGAGASVRGNVSAESVKVLGQVNGNITARERIDLKASARAVGDIKAKHLTVEDGVMLVGRIEVNPSGTPLPRAGEQAPTEPVADRQTPSDESKRGFFGKR